MVYLTMKKTFPFLIILCFFVTGIMGPNSVFAQEFSLPAPGIMVHLSPPFNPPILKGIKVYPDNPFKFEFILDRGDSKLSNDSLKDDSRKLIKYFLASLTIPEKDLWVNLSPYEKDRIIPQSFGLTAMGRDLLAEDYMLKQITASLIYPEDAIGKRFWKRIYEEAEKKFGTTNILINTFNKVWIVPEKAIVYENVKAGTAYVVESKLKVMLEQDYLSLQNHEGIQFSLSKVKDTNLLGNQIVREIVIPQLSKEVNENKNFVQLRQVFNSLILATWYKKKIKDSILAQVYADKNKIKGVEYKNSVIVSEPLTKAFGGKLRDDIELIYSRYLHAFKKGVYNYIKEEPSSLSQQSVPRKYFSGGMRLTDLAQMTLQTVHDLDRALTADTSHLWSINTDFTPTAPSMPGERPAKLFSGADEAMNSHQVMYLEPSEIENLSFENLEGQDLNALLVRLIRTITNASGGLREKAVKKLKEYVDSYAGLELIRKIARQLSYESKSSWFIFAVEELLAKSAAKNIKPEDFRYLEVDGKKYPLYVVHISDHLRSVESNGQMILELNTGYNVRSTIHFAVNGPIGYEPWNHKRYAYIIRLEDLIKENPRRFIGGREGDLMFYGPLYLPKSTVIIESTENTTITTLARSYLTPLIGREFHFTGWHEWDTPQEFIDRFRDLLLSQGLSYGHHGKHWTMQWEFLSDNFVSLFNALKQRDGVIKTWLNSGGDPALIEDFPYTTTFYANPSYFSDSNLTLSDKLMRPFVRIYVENLGISKDKFWKLCVLWLGRQVPKEDRDIFRRQSTRGYTERSEQIQGLIFPGTYPLFIPYKTRVLSLGLNESVWESQLISFFQDYDETGRNPYYSLSKFFYIFSEIAASLGYKIQGLREPYLPIDKHLFQSNPRILLDEDGAIIYLDKILAEKGWWETMAGQERVLFLHRLQRFLRFIFFDENDFKRDDQLIQYMFYDIDQYAGQKDGHAVFVPIRIQDHFPSGDKDTLHERLIRRFLSHTHLTMDIFPADYKIWTPEGLRNVHEVIKDPAMTLENPGGIDLALAAGILEAKNSSNGEIKFHINPAMFAQLQNAPGFVPVIINIQPMINLREFLGIT